MMPTGFLNTNFCLPTYVNCKRANRKLQPKNQVSIFWLLPPSPSSVDSKSIHRHWIISSLTHILMSWFLAGNYTGPPHSMGANSKNNFSVSYGKSKVNTIYFVPVIFLISSSYVLISKLKVWELLKKRKLLTANE